MSPPSGDGRKQSTKEGLGGRQHTDGPTDSGSDLGSQDQAAAILYLAVTFSKVGLFALTGLEPSQGAWEEVSQGELGDLQVSLCALKKSTVGHRIGAARDCGEQGQWGNRDSGGTGFKTRLTQSVQNHTENILAKNIVWLL